MLRQRGFGGGEPFRDDGEYFLTRRDAAFLGLRDFGQRLGVLRFDFAQAFLVELDAAFVAVNFRLQFQPALLLRGDFVFQFGQMFAQFGNFIFKPQNVVRAGFNFVAQIFHRGLALGNFALQHVELMPRQLRFQMLKLLLKFVCSGAPCRPGVAASRSAASLP